MRKLILSAAFLFSVQAIYAGNGNYKAISDSLRENVRLTDGKEKIAALIRLSQNAYRSDPEFSDSALHEAMILARQADNDTLIANCQMWKGVILIEVSRFEEALAYLDSSDSFFGKAGMQKFLPRIYNSYGIIYQEKGDAEKAIEYYLKGLEVSKALKDDQSTANITNNIAISFAKRKKNKEALKYFILSKDAHVRHGNASGRANTLNNIGQIYGEMGEAEKALDHLKKAFHVWDSINDLRGKAMTMYNIGSFHRSRMEIDKAIEHYERSYDLVEKLDDKMGMAFNLKELSMAYMHKKQYEKAAGYVQQSLLLAKELGTKEQIQSAHWTLASIYEKQNDFRKAYMKLKDYIAIKDTIENEKSIKIIEELQTKFETEKQKQEIKLLKKEGRINELERKRQSAIKRSLVGGSILLFLLVLVIFNRYRLKKKSHKVLEKKNNEIKKNRDEILEQKIALTDSINYAKRIQEALLQNEQHVTAHLPEHFILFKPKDIVSGDFYWSIEKKDYWYVTAADCTGHGVPGAFMSMLGISFLNEITASENILTPANILQQLKDKVVKDLGQTVKQGESNDGILSAAQIKDGMDISLFRLNLKTLELDWAGANNPLWTISPVARRWPSFVLPFKTPDPNELNFQGIEIKGDKQPIGYHSEAKPFTNHSIQLQKGDTIYIFSDGYPDQFGGPKGKKFKSKAFKELLLSIQDKTMEEQKQIIDGAFEHWRGELEQVDDVCVIGIRV